MPFEAGPLTPRVAAFPEARAEARAARNGVSMSTPLPLLLRMIVLAMCASVPWLIAAGVVLRARRPAGVRAHEHRGSSIRGQ